MTEGTLMDGMPTLSLLHFDQIQYVAHAQRTLKAEIYCVGVGLHGGQLVRLSLQPAPIDTGIVFRRTDLGIDIPARFDLVVDTKLCTVLAAPGRPDVRVATVEHVMAALAGAGVSNAIVAVDGPEIPILDGSAQEFTFLIACAGMVDQAVAQPEIAVLRSVRVELGEAYVELHPCSEGLELAVSIDFAAAAIGVQSLDLRVTPDNFRDELASARTFVMSGEIDALQQAGLARGGSLDNAVVVDGADVLNPGGLRCADEFVRHKMLDVVGDLALAGTRLRARMVGHRCGHALNNLVLRALFADDANWRLVSGAGWSAPAALSRGSAGSLAGLRDHRLALAASPA
jgi:UDP-3-O-[3-hydroxymyristoyl] N-acetylglucosamine deacetylase